MPFQNTVHGSLNEGLPGASASDNPFSSIVKKAINGCAPGLFLWGSGNGQTFSPAGSGKPDGFCIRTHTGLITGFLQEAQEIIPEGFNATAAANGDWYARSTTTALVKQKVFANTTTGTISTAAANSTVAGHVETDFVVTFVAAPGTAGSAIIISKY
ncbi:MAG TPA: hypothetical protein VNV36_05255 [Pseudomonas sp.]|uniref:structural cement protein Gp24 n=1 Tax=Pseudomonas sp. TaxID=306 RepID=UPI002CF01F9A|nr:hypothetical protein [Pseudomonas sp.]HWH86169.1 hypothetical protein [Pseudomonas sp.]